jgi:hypothetical protein
VTPGAHCALNEPCAVTELVPAGFVAVKLKVPLTFDDEELVITS